MVFQDQRTWQVAFHLGRANSIRADEGQPITIGSIGHTGLHVTINSPLGGTLTIGQDFHAGTGAVILGGPGVNAKLGDNVIDRRRRGRRPRPRSDRARPSATRPISQNSSFPANTVIPAGAIYVNNKFQGYVQS